MGMPAKLTYADMLELAAAGPLQLKKEE